MRDVCVRKVPPVSKSCQLLGSYFKFTASSQEKGHSRCSDQWSWMDLYSHQVQRQLWRSLLSAIQYSEVWYRERFRWPAGDSWVMARYNCCYFVTMGQFGANMCIELLIDLGARYKIALQTWQVMIYLRWCRVGDDTLQYRLSSISDSLVSLHI